MIKFMLAFPSFDFECEIIKLRFKVGNDKFFPWSGSKKK